MARPLFPANTGGRIRSSELLRRLSRAHQVTVICFRTPDDDPGTIAQMDACCSRLETVDWREVPKFSARFYASLAASLASPLPFTVRKYRSTFMRRRISALWATREYDLLLCDFLQPSINCLAERIRPKILFQHNVEAMIRHRHAEHAPSRAERAYLRHEAAKLARYEGQAASAFDHCIMVSEDDCRTMAAQYGASNTSAIPTGVDLEYFRPRESEASDLGIVFVGSMDWLPNQDAVEFFTQEVLPLIRREVPATFVIAGRNPPEAIRRLARSPGITVTGTVPDVRPFVSEAQVVVVPLRIGGGTRIKIFEALAMGKAVVSTSVGAEGLPVTPGRDILVGDDAAVFSAHVVRLLKDEDARRTLGVAGRTLVAQRFSWDAAATRFSEICAAVVGQVGARPA